MEIIYPNIDTLGMLRIVRKFLFWPKTLAGETKWLCYADIVEKVVKVRDYRSDSTGYVHSHGDKYEWEQVGFAHVD